MHGNEVCCQVETSVNDRHHEGSGRDRVDLRTEAIHRCEIALANIERLQLAASTETIKRAHSLNTGIISQHRIQRCKQ